MGLHDGEEEEVAEALRRVGRAMKGQKDPVYDGCFSG